MTPEATPPDDAVVFRQDRRRLALMTLVTAAFLALGASYVLRPDFWQTGARSNGSIVTIGWITVSIFSLGLIACVAALARPAVVRLEPRGLSVRTVWGAYSRPWAAVGDFRVWAYRRSRVVVFDDTAPANPWLAWINTRVTGATSSLPSALGVDADDLIAAVEAAQARWR